MVHVPSPVPGAPGPGSSVPPPDYPGVPDTEEQESPRRQPKGEEPGISYEEDIPSDGADPEGEAEIRHVPARPELSPLPDHLNN